MLRKGVALLKEVRAELEKVAWPSREAILGGTAAVLLVSAFFVLFMGVADFFVTRLLTLVLR